MTVAQLGAFYENLETKELYKLNKIYIHWRDKDFENGIFRQLFCYQNTFGLYESFHWT